ncbi:hypothetical protein BgiMline_028974 [Biomphalaria glabrata]|nr:hypothetical protein BgiMline_025604 [Biomphalaria glabrata]
MTFRGASKHTRASQQCHTVTVTGIPTRMRAQIVKTMFRKDRIPNWYLNVATALMSISQTIAHRGPCCLVNKSSGRQGEISPPNCQEVDHLQHTSLVQPATDLLEV